MDIKVFISVKQAISADLYPVTAKSVNGSKIESFPQIVPTDLGLSDWMLNCFKSVGKTDGFNPEKTIIIFKHNDVRIDDDINYFSQVVEMIKGGYDIIGVAGTASFNPDHRLPNGDFPLWINHEPVSGNSGLVNHQLPSQEFNSFYGSPKEVKIADGLLLACSGRLFEIIEELLTPKFHRDFYDVAFTYNAHLRGRKIFVVCSSVTHFSSGQFGDNWRQESIGFYKHFSAPKMRSRDKSSVLDVVCSTSQVNLETCR